MLTKRLRWMPILATLMLLASASLSLVLAQTGAPLELHGSSAESDWTQSVAWGDYDGDGELDLAVGNSLQPHRIYRNIPA